MILTDVIWQSKNGLWEVTLEKNDMFLYFKKDLTKYSIVIKNDGFWQTYVKSTEEVPAYVKTAIERNYIKLKLEGEIM
ncbi:hypothetical protein HMPREF1210_00143 [Paenisporosarcina sp. HGH0030]|uniref:hypothetical protein n=1 Tax=Paenisporosarcina sp. HGH0030 TaxID=1078085 RepID=UPI00034E3E75|nr:hypothetical protein [Paenisporosarcina sp. HGH0030]EPD54158.1 hypothetical protein HMPREF1210_00143 [Paenisporosarcina sp. HGH0030]